ncbi:MAG: xanthine dehydrogenase molybdopterin binding subunit, partial [Bdellovibrionaceae bacterium]|nr:xanthine dehydrogenase molybdopterin binding subunit [Pseudobdellovibrionaceae bacterium]
MSKRPHDSAHLHVTGKSEYVDDRPVLPGEVFVEVVFSTEPHARIKKIDFSAARKTPGVLGVFTADEFHSNLWGTIFKDQPLLAK